ncbi:hypothetical protein [Streptosporangium canum]|uniref:hypothetical protein n=1 Tax=Streptosporangium canum TaxID=324952 RepID=UPI003F4BAEC1
MATIGAYGFGGEFFPQRLRHADVRLLLDLRRRRGVRGPDESAREGAGQPGVVHEHPVAHRDQPVRGGRDPFVVRDDHEGLPRGTQVLEDPQHIERGRGVEVAGRLVGQDDQRVVGQRAGDGDPLTLPARQLRGQMPGAVGEPDPFQQQARAPSGPPSAEGWIWLS